ncbi:hypothetical protein Tco_0714502 [Tanacetum coccineum]
MGGVKGFGNDDDVSTPTQSTAEQQVSEMIRFILSNPNNFNHIASSPAMVLDDECVVERDLDNFVMGEVKDFSSINNLRVLLSTEIFDDKANLWGVYKLRSCHPTEKENSSDPFNLYNLLNKRTKARQILVDSSIPFPPGFTPEREFQHVDAQEVQGMENSLSKRRSEGLSSRVLEDA